MIVLLDNYDSFTYNLFQYISELGEEVVVLRNNETSISEIEKYSPSHLVISPGPSNPENAGISNDSIQHFSKKIPVLGVCLGHQCLGNTYGANIIQAEEIMHGKISKITHDGKGLFDGVPNPFKAVRYHSLIIDEDSLPNNFEITARSESGIIQGIRHKSLSLEGVQFHPESIETEHGKKILNNFLKMK